MHRTFELDFVTVEAVEAGYNSIHEVNDCVGYVLTFSDDKSVYMTVGICCTIYYIYSKKAVKLLLSSRCSNVLSVLYFVYTERERIRTKDKGGTQVESYGGRQEYD